MVHTRVVLVLDCGEIVVGGLIFWQLSTSVLLKER